MQQVADNKLFYQVVDLEKNIQEIKMLQPLFSKFDLVTVYKETNSMEELKNFNIDSERNKLILYSKTKAGRGTSEKYLSLFKIFDLERQEYDYEGVIKNKDLIGRLESGMYTFVEGNYYYNNNIIKIRFDMLLNNKDVQYEAEDILDTYLDCFILGPGERVRTDTPLNSYQSHRLAYIITDKNREKPLRVLVVPYLHERRIYLNRLKPSAEYFYTTIETTYEAEKNYNAAIDMAVKAGKPLDSVDIVASMAGKQKAGLQK
jgi:hypothetical protein